MITNTLRTKTLKIYHNDQLTRTLDNYELSREQIFEEIAQGIACLQDVSKDNHLIELKLQNNRFKVTQYPLTREEIIDGAYYAYNDELEAAYEDYVLWADIEPFKEDKKAEEKTEEPEVDDYNGRSLFGIDGVSFIYN